MPKTRKTYEDGSLVSTEVIPGPPVLSVDERKASVSRWWGQEGPSLLLKVMDERDSLPPGKTLADILAKVT